MKYFLTILTLLSLSSGASSQDNDKLGVLETDSTWRKEIFDFPLSFANDIKYKGIEDARFPVGWEKKDSNSFWSYAFAWSIDIKPEMTAKELESDLQKYFDGLMRSVNGGKEVKLENTIALFVKKAMDKDKIQFLGKVRMFDAFFTKENIILNVIAEQHYCKQDRKTIILFRFSPKEYENKVWVMLEKVKPRNDSCDR